MRAAAAPQQGTLAASFPPGGPYKQDTRQVEKDYGCVGISHCKKQRSQVVVLPKKSNSKMEFWEKKNLNFIFVQNHPALLETQICKNAETPGAASDQLEE